MIKHALVKHIICQLAGFALKLGVSIFIALLIAIAIGFLYGIWTGEFDMSKYHD